MDRTAELDDLTGSSTVPKVYVKIPTGGTGFILQSEAYLISEIHLQFAELSSNLSFHFKSRI